MGNEPAETGSDSGGRGGNAAKCPTVRKIRRLFREYRPFVCRRKTATCSLSGTTRTTVRSSTAAFQRTTKTGYWGKSTSSEENKSIVRFISTHPDQDHLSGLTTLDDHIRILNFYVVKNEAEKDEETDDFKRYKELRDGDKAFYLYKGCTRRWMNQSNEERGNSGINIRWPVTSNEDFKKALEDAAEGQSPNNISPVITYSLERMRTASWKWT